MSTAKASVSLPKSLGGINLVESFNKISLSDETKGFLSALSASLSVTWNPGASVPTLEVVDKRGNQVCSIDEFVKLGGYRRWVNDELKKIEKEFSSSERVTLMAYFLREATEKQTTLPLRMVDANGTKFNQYRSMVDCISTNLEAIDGCIDNAYKTYLKEKGKKLVNMFYKLMLDCVKPQKIEKETLEEGLFNCSIPKWIYNKLVDKQFTANLQNDATSLLFPKGNYLKAVSLTTKELHDEEFLSANETIVQKSGAIIALSKGDYKGILPKVPSEVVDDIDHFYENMMWTLNSPYTFEQILDVRAGGKAPPSFKERQKPNPRPGTKARAETDTQRICREISNTIGKLMATFLHFQNLVIQVSDPLVDFWQQLLPKITWDITASHGLYQNIKESKMTVPAIKDLTNDPLLTLMGEVMCQTLHIPVPSARGQNIVALVNGLKDKSEFVKQKEARDAPAEWGTVDFATMEAKKLTLDDLDVTKVFLGVNQKKKSSNKKRSNNRSGVRLSSAVLNELSVIKDSGIYPNVKEWLGSTFQSGQRNLVQLAAARRVVGAVLANQDVLLGEDFDEYETLQTVEEYEEA